VQLDAEERRALNAPGLRLSTLVLRGWQPIRGEVEWYVSHGVTERCPGPTAPGAD